MNQSEGNSSLSNLLGASESTSYIIGSSIKYVYVYLPTYTLDYNIIKYAVFGNSHLIFI
jgi:hypothetical protein